jgi:hypothetical protein
MDIPSEASSAPFQAQILVVRVVDIDPIQITFFELSRPVFHF